MQQFNQYSGEARELGFNIIAHSGDPAGTTAKKGTIYIKTDASGTTDRMWINTTGSTAWAYVTTSA